MKPHTSEPRTSALLERSFSTFLERSSRAAHTVDIVHQKFRKRNLPGRPVARRPVTGDAAFTVQVRFSLSLTRTAFSSPAVERKALDSVCLVCRFTGVHLPLVAVPGWLYPFGRAPGTQPYRSGRSSSNWFDPSFRIRSVFSLNYSARCSRCRLAISRWSNRAHNAAST